MPQFVPKIKPYLEASRSPKVEKWNASKSCESRGCIHCDLCYEHKDLGSVWSFRRFIVEEDPLFHRLSRTNLRPGSSRVSIGIPNLAWELNKEKDKSKTNQMEQWLESCHVSAGNKHNTTNQC